MPAWRRLVWCHHRYSNMNKLSTTNNVLDYYLLWSGNHTSGIRTHRDDTSGLYSHFVNIFFSWLWLHPPACTYTWPRFLPACRQLACGLFLTMHTYVTWHACQWRSQWANGKVLITTPSRWVSAQFLCVWASPQQWSHHVPFLSAIRYESMEHFFPKVHLGFIHPFWSFKQFLMVIKMLIRV